MEFLPNETHMLDLQLSMSDPADRVLVCVDGRTNTWRMDRATMPEWACEQWEGVLRESAAHSLKHRGPLPGYVPNADLQAPVYYVSQTYAGTKLVAINFDNRNPEIIAADGLKIQVFY